MAEPIIFNEIPQTRIPGVYAEFNLKAGRRLLAQNTNNVLYIANAGSAAATDELIDIYGADDAAALTGYGSLLHRMVLAGQKANRYQSIQAILIDDDAWGAAASISIPVIVTEEAIKAGFAEVRINKDVVRVDVGTDSSDVTIKDALVAAINAEKTLPVTADIAAGGDHDLVITSKTKGFVGGLIKVSARCTAVGFGFDLPVTPLTTASTKPEASIIESTLALVAAAGHTLIVLPFVSDEILDVVKTHVDFVSSGVEKRGVRVAFASPSLGDIADAKASSSGNNSWRFMNLYARGSRSWEPEIAAAAIGIIAGQQDPGMPVNDLELVGVDAPLPIDRFRREEVEDMLKHGVSPLGVGPGDVVKFIRAISTYTTTENGVLDDSLLDFTKAGTADYVRKACVERIQLMFPRVKRSARVLRKIRSELLRVLKALEDLEIIEDVDRWKDDLVVVADPNDAYGSVARVPAAIVPGLHVIRQMIDLL